MNADVRELFPLYALGVLEADEAVVVQRAIATDPERPILPLRSRHAHWEEERDHRKKNASCRSRRGIHVDYRLRPSNE